MKTLQQFWYYFEGEKPLAIHAREMADKNLSMPARYAFQMAASLIQERAEPGTYWTPDEWALANHPAALRDLSMNLMPALEEMHKHVPAYVAPEPVTINATFQAPKGWIGPSTFTYTWSSKLGGFTIE